MYGRFLLHKSFSSTFVYVGNVRFQLGLIRQVSSIYEFHKFRIFSKNVFVYLFAVRNNTKQISQPFNSFSYLGFPRTRVEIRFTQDDRSVINYDRSMQNTARWHFFEIAISSFFLCVCVRFFPLSIKVDAKYH